MAERRSSLDVRRAMSFEVTDVTKPLVAVRRIMEKGMRSTSGRSATSGTSIAKKKQWRRSAYLVRGKLK